MSASNLELVRHIKDEVDFILDNTGAKSKDDVLSNKILCRAIERSLEIIGEASKRVDEEFRALHSHIEWRKMAGTRDRLIHDYFGVDYDILWDIIINKLPDLQIHLEELLSES
jgi:uncharacterized protein with HEPN domain